MRPKPATRGSPGVLSSRTGWAQSHSQPPGDPAGLRKSLLTTVQAGVVGGGGQVMSCLALGVGSGPPPPPPSPLQLLMVEPVLYLENGI